MPEKKYHFDEKSAQRAVDFIEKLCTHVKGDLAGQPLLLEHWQKEEIIRPLFGWKRKDGTRKYRYAWIELPRKNGKTNLSSAIALYLLFGDGEPGAEIYCAAAAKEQANICFEISTSMIRQNDILYKNAEIYKNSIVLSGTSSFYKCLSSDAYSKHGINAHGIVFDEIHAQPNRELWDVLTTSIGSRKQPIVVCITTAGVMRKEHIAWQLHKRAKDIKNGIIEDDQMLSVIYQAESTDDPFSEDTWKKCNPNYGVSLKKQYLEDEAKKAKQEPTYLNTFMRLHLNVWTSTERQFISPQNWEHCNLAPLTEKFFYGKQCTIAFDLSATTDFTALAIATMDELKVRHVYVWTYIPELRAQHRAMSDQIAVWERQGWVTVVPGKSLDYEFVYKKINELNKLCIIKEVSYDRWNKNWLSSQLEKDGVPMYDFRQGFKTMSPATKEFEKLVIEKKINHGGNPVLEWMNSNMAVTQDAAGNIKPDKGKSTEKIDSMIAAIMAIIRLGEVPEIKTGSVYAKRGVLSL